MIASSPRHEMEIHIRMGADENGIVKAIDLYTLSNTGAYGEHGPTTVGLSGHKSIALYRHTEAYRFAYDVVYTNMQAAGATVAMVPHRVFLPWSPQQMSWPIRWAWIR